MEKLGRISKSFCSTFLKVSLILALVLFVGMGCNDGGDGVTTPSSPIVGNWSMTQTWYDVPVSGGTATVTSTYSLSISNDGSFQLANVSGTWELNGQQITLTNEAGTVVHTGTVDSTYTYMEGTASNTDGDNWDWVADKVD